MLTKTDKWLIVILLVVAAAGIGGSLSIFGSGGSSNAEIHVDGRLVKTIPLKSGYYENYTVERDGHHNVIEVNNGKVRMQESNCPDQVCVRTGWIEHAPQQIVCLPYRVVVKVTAAHNDVDDIAR